VRTTHIRNFLFVVSILRFGTLAFGQVCEPSVPLGICGPYYYSPVTGSNGSNVNVQNDFWNSANAPAGSSQTMHSISPGNWFVEANFANGNTAVESYPDSDAIYTNSPPLLSSYSYRFSSFAENMNLKSNTAAEAAYDIWLNGYGNEVMIWNDVSNRGGPGFYAGCTSTPPLAQVVFGGSYGVPKHLWDLIKCPGTSEIVWQLDQQALSLCGITSDRRDDPVLPHESVDIGTPSVYGITRGSVDVYAMLTWLVTNGYLPSETSIEQIEYGFEIASTGGADERFQVTGWSITDSNTPRK
jgi:hypothetical protein